MSLKLIADYASDFCMLITCATLLVKPIREKIFGIQNVKSGLRCMLRSVIVGIYYRNYKTQQLKEYEYELLCSCYSAYVSLGGNSFIKKIFKEIQDEWTIIK